MTDGATKIRQSLREREQERQRRLQEQQTRQLEAQINSLFIAAGWTEAESNDNFREGFVTVRGELVAIRGIDPSGQPHSGCAKNGPELAAFLLSLGIKPARKPSASVPAPAPSEAEGTPPAQPSEDAERIERQETPVPLPPNPAEAKLSDYGEVGEPGDEVESLRDLMKSDPSGFAERVKGLSTARRKILTDSFRQRMNELNNDRLRGVRLNPVDAEWLEDHQTLYHLLAESGDA